MRASGTKGLAVNDQLELFAPRRYTIEEQWRACWGWDGPEVGGFCEVDAIAPQRADGAGSLYCYMEQCRVLEVLPGGRYIVEIAMGEVWGKPWPKDGTRLILEKNEVWAPTRAIRKAREESTDGIRS